MQGIVLQTFGAGNFPSLRADLIDVIRESVMKKCILIVNVSQCQHGEVDELSYATGEVQGVKIKNPPSKNTTKQVCNLVAV